MGTRVEEIDEAVKRYVNARDSRMTYLDKEVEAKAALIEVMEGYGYATYHWNGQVVRIESKTKVSVTTAKERADADD